MPLKVYLLMITICSHAGVDFAGAIPTIYEVLASRNIQSVILLHQIDF
jgi:hypothetical protein